METIFLGRHEEYRVCSKFTVKHAGKVIIMIKRYYKDEAQELTVYELHHGNTISFYDEEPTEKDVAAFINEINQ